MNFGAVIVWGFWGGLGLGVAYGLSWDLRRWWQNRRAEARADRRLAAMDENDDLYEAYLRSLQANGGYYEAMARQRAEILSLPETEPFRWIQG